MSVEFHSLVREGIAAYRELEESKAANRGGPWDPEIERRCNELLGRIGREYKPEEDVWISQPLTFKLARGAVPLEPRSSAGLRLVQFLIQHGVEV